MSASFCLEGHPFHNRCSLQYSYMSGHSTPPQKRGFSGADSYGSESMNCWQSLAKGVSLMVKKGVSVVVIERLETRSHSLHITSGVSVVAVSECPLRSLEALPEDWAHDIQCLSLKALNISCKRVLNLS